MKAFAIGTALAVVIAIIAGIVLEGFLSRDAYLAFSSPGARVGHENSAEARQFSGGNGEG